MTRPSEKCGFITRKRERVNHGHGRDVRLFSKSVDDAVMNINFAVHPFHPIGYNSSYHIGAVGQQ